ncbi:MAG: hypothetical protein ABR82_05085 [Verrucomicrobia subdivision 6 bacterium BACL9 MAG-120507-bin52]|uniref:Uncharacterized protein n=1 Tax=Verrucomicrobia subdivision 6 bacterium BACL9 MAG-120507-bin52 TaxID=1655590 RepID=A0A0R2RHT8_9BACT|nr:MAG: hypothetical protein ABR82_05085 [Verrucomicrobia subdivision 6 bacterium BACL9 MAG-120507-bin52]
MEDGVILPDRLQGRWGSEGGLRKVVVAGEDRLAVVENEGEVSFFQRPKLDQESVLLSHPQFFPLVGFDLM